MSKKLTLKEIFLREKVNTKPFQGSFPQDKQKLPMSDKDIDQALEPLGTGPGELSTKSFGKHFPQDKQKLPMSDKDIDQAVSTLGEEDKGNKPEKSFFKLGKLEPEFQKNVPLEKPSDEPSVKQTNKELGNFKSLLEDEEEMYESDRGLEKEKPESPFDDAFKKHQEDEEKKQNLTSMDEPFSNNLEECGCGNVEMPPEVAMSQELPEEEYGPTEFVVIKLGDNHSGGLNVKTRNSVEYGAPEGRKLAEEEGCK